MSIKDTHSKPQGADQAAFDAFHDTTRDGNVVGVGNLRVLLRNADGYWFAQGLEIDYAAQGETIEDVQQRFEHGLECTIREHLKVFGTIERLLVPAPGEVWRELVDGKPKCVAKRHSQLSIHPFFEAFAYYSDAIAA
jgi:hypothetical protein